MQKFILRSHCLHLVKKVSPSKNSFINSKIRKTIRSGEHRIKHCRTVSRRKKVSLRNLKTISPATEGFGAARLKTGSPRGWGQITAAAAAACLLRCTARRPCSRPRPAERDLHRSPPRGESVPGDRRRRLRRGEVR